MARSILADVTVDFSLDGHGPPAYERHLVPAVFAECADRLLDMVPPRPGDRVLDVACGTGIVARRAATRADLSRLAGADANPGMLDVARSVPVPAAPNAQVDWYDADATDLPFSDASFDVVYCQQGLQYITDRTAALREMARVLAPGGRLGLAIWRSIDHSPGFGLLVEELERQVGPEAAAIMRTPFAGPSLDEVRELLAQAGLADAVGDTAPVGASFASPREFLRIQVLASPRDGLARLLLGDERNPKGEHGEPVEQGDHGGGEASGWRLDLGNLDRTLAPYVGARGLVLPMRTWLISARRAAVPTVGRRP